jgi:CheY-like chemotaxis protein/anti-sigma regulatory factor (Ser/Thr protein kinase)
LCTNAYHAVGDNPGAIGISCHSLDKPIESCNSEDHLIPGAYIVIEVTDTGTGMSKAIMEQIFEPYFTTKEKGKGTGLGLSIVKAIVNTHRGRIHVESTEGKGSIFRVFFPKQDTTKPVMQKVGSGKWEIGDNERILLAENDEITGPMLVDALTAIKYKVKLARNGMEAFELFMQDPASFDILIADLIMPKLGGLELTQKIRALRPEIYVVLMSGNPEALSGGNLTSLGINAFLKKPFDIGELSRSLKGIGKKDN